MTEGIERSRQLTYTQPLATGLAALAWIRQAQGDHAGALEAMGEAGRVAPDPAVPGLLNPIPAQRARLLLAQGDAAAAARWTEERGLAPDDDPGYPREPEYLVLARVLLAQDRHAQALALLGRMHAAGPPRGVPEVSSRSARCGRWPWPRRVTRTPRWMPWPRRSCSAVPGVMSGCSPTRGRRWPR